MGYNADIMGLSSFF